MREKKRDSEWGEKAAEKKMLAFGVEASLAAAWREFDRNKPSSVPFWTKTEYCESPQRETETLSVKADIWARPAARFSCGLTIQRNARSTPERAFQQFALLLLLGDETVFLFFFFFKSLPISLAGFFFFFFTSAPAGSWHSAVQTAHRCHVHCPGGEMISIGLLLMRLPGSVAGGGMGPGLRAWVRRWLSVRGITQHNLQKRKDWAELKKKKKMRGGIWTWRMAESKLLLLSVTKRSASKLFLPKTYCLASSSD